MRELSAFGNCSVNLAEPNVPLVAVCGSGLAVTFIGSLHDAIAINNMVRSGRACFIRWI